MIASWVVEQIQVDNSHSNNNDNDPKKENIYNINKTAPGDSHFVKYEASQCLHDRAATGEVFVCQN